tara:strand:+ start:341 stop:478 length:138 start_codon:yes stop_codon:yes gene_type:complete
LDFGFNPDKLSWFYLMEMENEQQLGITNNLEERIQHLCSIWLGKV